MSGCDRPALDEDFVHRLETLRLKIDQLPAEHRPHLYELADVIAKQHQRLQTRGPRQQ